MRMEIRFAGVGGQGLVRASIVLAEAAGIQAGLHVVQTQFYGFETEGGPSCGDVVLGDAPVEYPWVRQPDLLVAMAQPAVYEHAPFMRPGTRMLVDDLFVTDVAMVDRGVTVLWAPLTKLADQAGFRKSANMVALAACARLTGLLTYDRVESALRAAGPGHFKVNQQALRLGWEADLRSHVFAPGEKSAYMEEGFRGV
ncbi:MAG: 2-oxoacid:acceptor oxidoreductase family protein [Candidatus Lambdaproteobacteria bacterium]|nr:2-oxoacid:acceptor oxidoreductase family protein [Candidatus Lambdaproteobacteria bacterium]